MISEALTGSANLRNFISNFGESRLICEVRSKTAMLIKEARSVPVVYPIIAPMTPHCRKSSPPRVKINFTLTSTASVAYANRIRRYPKNTARASIVMVAPVRPNERIRKYIAACGVPTLLASACAPTYSAIATTDDDIKTMVSADMIMSRASFDLFFPRKKETYRVVLMGIPSAVIVVRPENVDVER